MVADLAELGDRGEGRALAAERRGHVLGVQEGPVLRALLLAERAEEDLLGLVRELRTDALSTSSR